MFRYFSLFLILGTFQVFAQLDFDAYEKYLEKTKGYKYDDLKSLYNDDLYYSKIPNQSKGRYFDSANKIFNFTDYEKYLLKKHGFFVTERLSYDNWNSALLDVYNNDLPVFISSDLLLHCLHLSYDNILIAVEREIFIPKLKHILSTLKGKLPEYNQKYSTNEKFKSAVNDLDVYLTVASQLLNKTSSLMNQENKQKYLSIINDINSLSLGNLPIFSNRDYDYSQFTVRGHYTQSEELGAYFKSMMWLGRTEIYLSKPKPEGMNPVSDEDLHKQIIAASILAEIIKSTGIEDDIKKIDDVLKAYIGESDNVKSFQLDDLLKELGVNQLTDLGTKISFDDFTELLKTKDYAKQRILSQVLWSNPLGGEKIEPASAFLLLGQRFIVDSYIFANLVNDKVPMRMLPNSLDVLFTLGNNSALQFLKSDIETFDFAPNIAALRYLIDANSNEYWTSSLYNVWLNSIRSLNPPLFEQREKFPPFMRTAAFWQQKMNTQLSSWTELRHDNLLYAKQSYSGGIGCSYPYSYLEPFPQLYRNMSTFMRNFEESMLNTLKDIDQLPGSLSMLKEFMPEFYNITDKLAAIAEKELSGAKLSDEETDFLKKMLSEKEIDYGCGTDMVPDGWLADMIYSPTNNEILEKSDYLIADVHTSPTDELGNIVGWVKHVATGDINMMVADIPYLNGEIITFCGPVLSYYEYTSMNFERLTDQEWEQSKDEIGTRPYYTDLYLANKEGNSKGEQQLSLLTSLNDEPVIPNSQLKVSAYPNPAVNYSYLNISVPAGIIDAEMNIQFFDIKGNIVNELQFSSVHQGDFVVKIDMINQSGNKLNTGAYYYKVNINGTEAAGMIIKTR